MEEKKFVCECGRSFDKIRGMTGHQKNCQTHKDAVKQKKEARRLPNGMFKCENPDCGKEHDGSYGSGRFCSNECRRHYIAVIGAKTAIKNGNKHRPANFKNTQHAEYGRWKCTICNNIFYTRAKLTEHRKSHGFKLHHAWNKGLTKETCKSIANACQKISDGVKRAIAAGACCGRAKTLEAEILRRKRASIAALNRTTPSVCKKTEPYVCVDGSIVKLDSSYERTVAKLLDEHYVKWNRPKPLVWFDKKNIQHHYFPDFYLIDYDVYLDPKNDYCFKVQKEKIDYIMAHYSNCFFLNKNQLTWEFINSILEQYSRSHTSAAC